MNRLSRSWFFFLSITSMSTLHLDFETRSVSDLRKVGADVYARHPTTEILCVGFAFDEEPVKLWPPGGADREICSHADTIRLLEHIQQGGLVVAHNAPFELAIWNHVGRKQGWPELKAEQTVCTMAMAYAMSLPGSLEGAAAATGIREQKDMQGNRIMLQLCKPKEGPDPHCRHCQGSGVPFGKDETCICVSWWQDPEKYQRLYAYCGQDIKVERELARRLMNLSQREREVWLLDYKINQRGVQVDLQAASKALEMVEMEKERLDQEMKKVTKNAVATCTATGQLSDWLKSKGLVLEGVAKSDVTELLSNPELPADCRQALLLRQEAAKSSTAKLAAMMRGTCTDGRSRGLFQYHGAGTGRWAGRRIQLQNLPRPRLSQIEVDQVFEILTAVK